MPDKVSPVEAQATAGICFPFARIWLTMDTSTVIPRSLNDPVCSFPQSFTQRSRRPISRPIGISRRSALSERSSRRYSGNRVNVCCEPVTWPAAPGSAKSAEGIMLSCFSPNNPCWGLNRTCNWPGKHREMSSRALVKSGPTLGIWFRKPRQ